MFLVPRSGKLLKAELEVRAVTGPAQQLRLTGGEPEARCGFCPLGSLCKTNQLFAVLSVDLQPCVGVRDVPVRWCGRR